jgi:UDP-apiose/xylose synthase
LIGRPNFTFVRQDIRKPAADLAGLIRDSDLVIDLIAYANPGIYVRQPLEVFRLNFTENLGIAEHCSAHGRRLIQFSSCEVYGKTVAAILPGLPDPENPAYATFSEDESSFILGPVHRHRWIYACAKQLLERVLHAYGLEDRLDYSIVRPFNFIGPKIDYLPLGNDGAPRVFSCFMQALLTGRPMQLVNGGVHRRCYTFIADAIECIWRIQNEVSIRQLAERMRAIYTGAFLKPGAKLSDLVSVSAEEFYGRGYEDSDRRIPDISKARKLLGWEPRVGLDEILERTMRYYIKEI